ncbi:MAG: hypothetical protein K2N44_01470 [Lachnospiraceae bacterium]|nr:hypothetical protein [Lachnospiraceae bacterium]
MRLLGWELRKIVNPGIIAAVVLLGVVYYFLFAEFYIQYFCNGANAEAEFALSSEWAVKYGVTMEASERAELDAQLADELEIFRKGLLLIPEALEAGIVDYGSFCEYTDRYLERTAAGGNVADMEQERLRWQIMGRTNYYRIQALEQFIASYDRVSSGGISGRALPDYYTAAMRRRDNELMQSEQKYGFFPTCVYDSTREYGRYLAVWCVLSIILLLSPVLVRDRLCRTRALQWSSSCGRTILRTQMTAACIVGFVVTVVNLVVYGIPFLQQNPLIFKDFGLESLWGSAAPWFDWTYGTYLIVLAGLILVLSMATVLLTVFLSQYSGNYIPMLLKALPLFVVLGPMIGSWVMDNTFYFRELWKGLPIGGFCGMETVMAVFLLVLGIGFCVSAGMRQSRVELY